MPERTQGNPWLSKAGLTPMAPRIWRHLSNTGCSRRCPPPEPPTTPAPAVSASPAQFRSEAPPGFTPTPAPAVSEAPTGFTPVSPHFTTTGRNALCRSVSNRHTYSVAIALPDVSRTVAVQRSRPRHIPQPPRHTLTQPPSPQPRPAPTLQRPNPRTNFAHAPAALRRAEWSSVLRRPSPPLTPPKKPAIIPIRTSVPIHP